jgi:chemotaxis protein CheD
MAKLRDLIDIFLQPGEYFVADAGYQLRTMLGSCVSITLWEPVSRIGAMSHFLLPARGAHGGPVQELDGRYGDEALELMRRDLARTGVRLSQCQAKIFGGGNMFPGQARTERMHVGRKNGEAARKMLLHHGIPIVSESLFGVGHRQIIFDVSNGDVWAYQVKLSREEARANGLDE